MAFRINPSEKVESIEVKLKDYPIAFRTKCEEFVEQGLAKTMNEAEQMLADCVIDLEIMYEKHNGLIGVESGAIESQADIYSPYTSELGQYHVCPECGSTDCEYFLDVDCDDMGHCDSEGYRCNECGYSGTKNEFYEN